MKLATALKLHNQDEVLVKKTNKVMNVVEIQRITDEASGRGRIIKVMIMLTDGNWYNHKEIS